MFFHFLIGIGCHLFNDAFYGVDFLFILSSIVLLHSYGNRISDGLHFSQFVKLRLNAALG